MVVKFAEQIVEEATVNWLKDLSYSHLFGPDIACDGLHPERTSYADLVIVSCLLNSFTQGDIYVMISSWKEKIQEHTRNRTYKNSIN